MDKNKKRKIIDKKSFHDFVYTTSLAFTMQTLVATIVMFISSSSTASEQSRISSIYETPGFLSKSTLLQFFVVALLTGVIRHIFMSDLILKIKSMEIQLVPLRADRPLDRLCDRRPPVPDRRLHHGI